MAEIVDSISSVDTKELPTGVVLYLVKDSKGKEYSTRDRTLAQAAYKTIGGYALFDFTEKKNERGYVNRYLNHLAPVEAPAEPQGEDGPPAGLFDDTAPEPTVSLDKDLQIAKAVALKAAVELMQYFEPEHRTSTNVTGVAEYFTQWLIEWKP
jgi:hypothetical protein